MAAEKIPLNALNHRFQTWSLHVLDSWLNTSVDIVRTTCISSDYWERTGTSFKSQGRGKNALNNPFFQNLHRDITVRTQFDKDNAEMKIKWDGTRATFNVHYRGSPVRKSNSATRVLLTLCTFQQRVESHLGKNQTQPKILIAFLFSQLHFNNVHFACPFSRRPSCYAQ